MLCQHFLTPPYSKISPTKIQSLCLNLLTPTIAHMSNIPKHLSTRLSTFTHSIKLNQAKPNPTKPNKPQSNYTKINHQIQSKFTTKNTTTPHTALYKNTPKKLPLHSHQLPNYHTSSNNHISHTREPIATTNPSSTLP